MPPILQAVSIATADISAATIAVTKPLPLSLKPPKPFLATESDDFLGV
jgi:hypothetical protein